ncbi:hypothetical protein EK21DRAFT_92110 [Setomelanomma holmii]|uniref:Uncharacterized protein n=1 Tax=Setomelanomma holmii TaxID=210430 RepID=A0A9P4H3U1_9PLEO|nr:hypothetical protein EK21DRAFT_92110 [Setomelanomma holmii]
MACKSGGATEKQDTPMASLPDSPNPEVSTLNDPEHNGSGIGRLSRRIWGLSCLPAPGTALQILGSSSLLPAFLPGYTNTWKSSSEMPDVRQLREAHEKMPAYTCPSMASWFRAPANSYIQADSTSLAPVGISRSESQLQRDRAQNPQQDLAKHPVAVNPSAGLSSDGENLERTAVVLSSATPGANSSSGTEYNRDARVSGPKNPSKASKLRRSSSNCELQAQYDLLGAPPQTNAKEPILWFYREPLPPIDEAYSADEDEDRSFDRSEDPMSRNDMAGEDQMPLAKSKNYGSLGPAGKAAPQNEARDISDSERSPTLMSEDLGFLIRRSTSATSHLSGSSSG